jgi:hypothetical protein
MIQYSTFTAWLSDWLNHIVIAIVDKGLDRVFCAARTETEDILFRRSLRNKKGLMMKHVRPSVLDTVSATKPPVVFSHNWAEEFLYKILSSSWVIIMGVNKFLPVLFTPVDRFVQNSVLEICIHCCRASVSLWKSAQGRPCVSYDINEITFMRVSWNCMTLWKQKTPW